MMRLPTWLGGHSVDEPHLRHPQDTSDLNESQAERLQIRREAMELQARLRALEILAATLGHKRPLL